MLRENLVDTYILGLWGGEKLTKYTTLEWETLQIPPINNPGGGHSMLTMMQFTSYKKRGGGRKHLSTAISATITLEAATNGGTTNLKVGRSMHWKVWGQYRKTLKFEKGGGARPFPLLWWCRPWLQREREGVGRCKKKLFYIK